MVVESVGCVRCSSPIDEILVPPSFDISVNRGGWRISLSSLVEQLSMWRPVSSNIVLCLEMYLLIQITMSWRWIDFKWFTNASYGHPIFMVMFGRERRFQVCFPTWRLKWRTSSLKLELKTEYIIFSQTEGWPALSARCSSWDGPLVDKVEPALLLSGQSANWMFQSRNLNIRQYSCRKVQIRGVLVCVKFQRVRPQKNRSPRPCYRRVIPVLCFRVRSERVPMHVDNFNSKYI